MKSLLKKSGIYRIKNIKNGRVYYGSTTKTFLKRKSEHFNDLKSNRHGNRFLQADFNKFGELFFIFEVLLLCKPEHVLLYEQIMIDLHFDNCKNCYNMCPKAENTLGRGHSEECILKMKQRKKSSYEKKKISKSIKELWKNEYYRRKIVQAMKNNREPTKHRSYDHIKHVFINDKLNRKEKMTQYNLRKKYNDLTPSGVSDIVTGRQKTHKGWRIVKKK